VLLEYLGDDDRAVASITLLLIDNLGNNYLDAINLEFPIELDEQGYLAEDITPVYHKIANITFPKDINKHTLIVLGQGKYYRFALITKSVNGELLFSMWKAHANKIDNVLRMNLTNTFNSAASLKGYGVALKNAILDSASDDVLSEFFSESIVCGDLNKVEVVYPNQRRDEIRPITIEYIYAGQSLQDSEFLGECYLISHRPKIDHPEPENIKELHIYLADTKIDAVLQDVNDKFLALVDANQISKSTVGCSGGSSPIDPCDNSDLYLTLENKGQRIFWHKNLPDEYIVHKNSIVIFNAHHHAGIFNFQQDRQVFFSRNLGGIIAPSYIINACGNAELRTIDEIQGNARYRNLIFPNKQISAREAAVNMYCSVKEFLAIDRGCVGMTDWMDKVKTCMGNQYLAERHRALVYHFIGQMDDQICVD